MWMKLVAILGIVGLLVLLYQIERKEEKTSSVLSQAPAVELKTPDFSTSTYRQKLAAFEWDNDQGQTLSHKDLLGHWTLINFWAHWCYPCHVELPLLSEAAATFSSLPLEIILVNVDSKEQNQQEEAKKLLADKKIELKNLYDPHGLLSRNFSVSQFPYHILIDPKGTIVFSEPGAVNWKDQRVRDSLTEAVVSQARSKGSTFSTK